MSIEYSQYAPDQDSYGVSLDDKEYEDILYMNITYFYNDGPVFDTVFWYYDGYVFCLKANFKLAEEELFRIIDSIALVEDMP